MKIRAGKRYRVCEGSGIDSGRVGTAINPIPELLRRIHEFDTGRYKPFDFRQEQILVDEQGQFFVMFKSRLMPAFDVERNS